ncbi:MAG TPA: alpha-amlyase, partial [Halomonas sp.]|nr:alpha-amlyase [Halomonas sp.]
PHYQRDDFHEPCGIEQSDYTQNAERVRQCQLVGLPDLNTSDPTVQSHIADYLDTLAALGV